MLKRLFFSALLLMLVGGGVGAYWYQENIVKNPGPQFERSVIEAIIAQESPVYARDGTTRIGVFFDQEHRQYLRYDQIPLSFVHALVAAEDGNYFAHPGFDPKHIVRAAWQNLQAGEVVAGGSTISQQTAKNLFYRPDRSLRSKWTELGNALKLEAHFSKEDILEFYANQFHVSANGRGLGIAARYFFDKEPGQLTTKECAFIAGMVKAPSRYNPFLGQSEARREEARKKAEDRTSYVLRRMSEEGYIDARTLNEALGTPLAFKRGTFQYDRSVILDTVQKQLEESPFVELFEQAGIDNPSTAGIRIITTIDPQIQAAATWGLWRHLSALGPVVDRSGAWALALPTDTVMPMEPGVPLQKHTFYKARVQQSSATRIVVDIGGRPCEVDQAGIERMAGILASARSPQAPADATAREALLRALPVGTFVLVSALGDGRCDLEIRPKLQGAVVVLEDGQIRAMVGGSDNRNFNRAIDSKRQFGSTWKPMVYLAALQLGWLPTDVLDNQRNVFPFRDVWYYPRPDHPSDPFVTMSMAGTRSENLASVWLLYHLTDRMSTEELRRVAVRLELLGRPGETPEAQTRRLQDEHGLRSSPERFEEYAFTAARQDTLARIESLPHPEDAAAVRSLLHGYGVAAERARLLATDASIERDARLYALSNNLLALEELAAACDIAPHLLSIEPTTKARACGRAPEGYVPWVDYMTLLQPPLDPLAPRDPWEEEAAADPLIDGRLHRSTLRALRAALGIRMIELQGRDPWDEAALLLHPDFRVLVGILALHEMVEELGVKAELPVGLSLPLGAADISLVEAASMYQGMLSGQAWQFPGEGFAEGEVAGLRSHFELPSVSSPAALIAEIRDAAGNVIYRATPTPTLKVDPLAGAMTGDILRSVVRSGTGRRAADAVVVGGQPLPLAGKTGTTNDYRNAAFIGFAPRTGPLVWGNAYTIAAYVGYDDNRPMRRNNFKVQGASGALPVWIATVQGIAEAGLLGTTGGEYPALNGLMSVPVRPGTGLVAEVTEGPTTLTGVNRQISLLLLDDPAQQPATVVTELLPAEAPAPPEEALDPEEGLVVPEPEAPVRIAPEPEPSPTQP